jgi:hypothetical protein
MYNNVLRTLNVAQSIHVEYLDSCDMIRAICDERPFPFVYRALPASGHND